ncbi:uncharacterized protein LOC133295644 isoform X2 [Gastrolobium bilobum]|uniref:uncharacterized protein LOC133295644 isoform X2 n=1 Tax=Gastrolobium bilobum TaxID=150636 RepID=UPI002AAF701D|nr:uncharacterized protein LOC133295644 isoform X2 [Gastrolobium bilobum]
MKEEEGDRNTEKAQDITLWGVFLFGVIGATITTFALSRSQSSWKGGSGSSFRSEEAWKRYTKRFNEEYEEELERVERIRRMQSVFNRERNKNKRSYESWRENGHGAYHQHFQRDDWYWKAEASFRNQRTNYRDTPRESGNYSLSHHYSVLGLDRFRTTPYTDAEIKTAFRTKAYSQSMRGVYSDS